MPAPEPSPEPSVPQPTTLPTPEPAEVPGPEPTRVPPTPAAAEEAPLEERPSGIPIEASSEAEVEPAEQTPVQAPAGVRADATLQEEEPLHGTPVGRDEAPPA